MANFIYKKAKQSFLEGEINAALNDFKILLIDTDNYVANENTDQYVSNINPSAIKWRTENLPNITTTDGILDADNMVISDYQGAAFDAIVLYQVGVTDSNSRLVFYIDSSENLPYLGYGLPAPVTIYWSNTNTRILSF